MPITGSQAAKMYSQAGVARCGATRSSDHSPATFLTVNGTQRRTQMQFATLAIIDNLDETPNTCRFTAQGFVPSKGQEVIVQLGSTNNRDRLFAGHIQSSEQIYFQTPARAANIFYRVSAIDYTTLLNRRLVWRRYTNQSASAIAVDLVASFAAGFTAANVATGLAVVDEITFASVTLAAALTSLAKRIGGYWYVDYRKDLHLFTGSDLSVTNPTALTASHASLSDLAYTEDLSQVATRVYVEGARTSAASRAPVGSPFLPIVDGQDMPSSGNAVGGNQKLTYTGGILTGAVPVPAVSWSVGLVPVGGSLVIGQTYHWRITAKTLTGETTVSAASPDLTPSGTSKTANTDWGTTLYSQDGTTAYTSIALYRWRSDLARYELVGEVDPTVQHALADAGTPTGGVAPPSTSTAGGRIATASTTTSSVSVGATTVPVTECRRYAGGGGVGLYVVDGLTYFFTYTGQSAIIGIGNLTGIPASGIGSITKAMASGAAVVNTPALKGIPPSGDGAIQRAVTAGDGVTFFVQVDDASAQTVLAALMGGDGIAEAWIQASGATATEAQALGQATLDLRSTARTGVRYRARDKNTGAGRTATVSLAAPVSVAGTFKLQQVQISDFDEAARRFPTYEADASSERFSLESLLRPKGRAA